MRAVRYLYWQFLYWPWERVKTLRYRYSEPPSVTVEPTDDMPDPDPPRHYR